MVRRQVRSIAVVLVALAFAASGCSSTDTNTKSEADQQRASLAAVETVPLDGAPELRLGATSEVPLVVNVWATWCAPCRKEMPAFDAVAKRFGSSVRFVGINLGDTKDHAQAFIDETGVTFDEYLDPDSTAQAALSITGMPATAFVRADGTVATIHNGALDEAGLEKLLKDRLGLEPPAGNG